MKSLTLAAVAATLMLAACDNKPEVVTTTAPDPLAAEVANRAPVELPPALKAEVTFRCKDNSLAYVSFFEGDKMALVTLDKAKPPVKLTAPEPGKPMTGEGYVVSGTPKAIELTTPAKPAQSCKA